LLPKKLKMKETKQEGQSDVTPQSGSVNSADGGVRNKNSGVDGARSGSGSNQGNEGNGGNNSSNPGSGNDSEGGAGKRNQITVQVRYQSDVVSVSVNKNASVEALLVDAIRSTENEVGKKDQFQLKLSGNVLDPHKKVSDYPITNGSLLVLGMVAGGGGSGFMPTKKCGS
jgi:hypothetical protein